MEFEDCLLGKEININNLITDISLKKKKSDTINTFNKAYLYNYYNNKINTLNKFEFILFEEELKCIINFLLNEKINSIDLKNITYEDLKNIFIKHSLHNFNKYRKLENFIYFIQKSETKVNFSDLKKVVQKEIPFFEMYRPDISYMSNEQLTFYKKLLKNFNSNIFLYVGDSISYVFTYLYSIIDKFKKDKNLYDFLEKFKYIYREYGDSKTIDRYLKLWLVDAYLLLDKYDEAWNIHIYIKDNIGLNNVLLIKNNCTDKFIDGKEFIKLVNSKRKLTPFGKICLENEDFIDFISNKLKVKFTNKKSENIILYFINSLKINNLRDKDFEILKEWSDNLNTFSLLEDHYKNILPDEYKKKKFYLYTLFSSTPQKKEEELYKEYLCLPQIVNSCLIDKLSMLIRDFENMYRKHLGLPKIGEGWYSETKLYKDLKKEFKDLTIINHAHLEWLGQQHLDIYIKEYNIAIEYQGGQHLKPVDFFGGLKSFEKQVNRDLRKRELCQLNKCYLIYIYPDYNLNYLILKINNIINNNEKDYIHNNFETEYVKNSIEKIKNSSLDKEKLDTQKVIEKWNKMYDKYTLCKNFDISINNYDEYKKIYRWIINQKNLYKRNKLSKDIIEKFNEINFKWHIDWNDMYFKLIDLKMTDKKITNELNKWILNQKLEYQNNNLTSDKIQKLLEINIELYSKESIWQNNYNLIKEQSTNINLNNDSKTWLKSQEKLFKDNKLELKKLKLLYDIDIFFKKTDKLWYLNFNKLIEYKSVNGHCNISRTYKENPSLGEWVKTQRKRYKNNSLDFYRKQLLDEIIDLKW